jgi:hypothetical protein
MPRSQRNIVVQSPRIDERPLIQVADPKTDEIKNPQVIVINTNPSKTEKKIRKIETIKKIKISKKQEPSELLKYYNYLSYEQPKLLQKLYENKDNDLVSGIKKAFGEDNKETLSSKVNTVGYDDPISVERLRNELFDANAKIAEDMRMEAQMAKDMRASTKITSLARMTRAKTKANLLREEK